MRLLTILCLVLLSVHSYSQEVVTRVETVERNGLYEEFPEKKSMTDFYKHFKSPF